MSSNTRTICPLWILIRSSIPPWPMTPTPGIVIMHNLMLERRFPTHTGIVVETIRIICPN